MSAPIARLRPEKFDDVDIQQHIDMIKTVCRDVDVDSIAIVFHECDYNMQKTIERLQAGDFEDGGWQTAKSNNKKKNHSNEQMNNGNTASDSERSLSQRTSPTPSQRSVQQQYSSLRSNQSQHEKETNSNEMNFSSKSNEISTLNNQYSNENRTDNNQHFLQPTIVQPPVFMHPIIGFSNQPIDIQFGDIVWQDAIPLPVTPSNSPICNQQTDDEHVLQIDKNENLIESENDLTTNNIEIEFDEPVSQLSSSSLSIPAIVNNEEISHLSDQLKDSTQENSSSTSQANNPSAFTPYPTSNTAYTQIARDYSQAWPQQQSINYKTNSKTSHIQTTNYPQQTSYPMQTQQQQQQQQQQQYYVGTYYPTHPVYPMFTSIEPWSTTGYESYPTYQPTNYIPTYSNQQLYHSNPKHDVYSYEKDYYNYNQTRLINPELSSSSQSLKDVSLNSKLSATAASFSQATNPTAFYLNPVVYPLQTYVHSPQDRTINYPSIDNRDNRNGASYNTGNPSNRTHYQRTHNNSTWHSQQ